MHESRSVSMGGYIEASHCLHIRLTIRALDTMDGGMMVKSTRSPPRARATSVDDAFEVVRTMTTTVTSSVRAFARTRKRVELDACWTRRGEFARAVSSSVDARAMGTMGGNGDGRAMRRRDRRWSRRCRAERRDGDEEAETEDEERPRVAGDASGRRAMSRRAAMATAIGTVGGLTRPRRAAAFIELPSRLHNRYFFVRHGESVLDVRKQVLSNPSFKYDATFGLTGRGREQMREAARIILEEYDGAPAWLYTSNFQRSFQSALVLREELGLLFSQMRTEFSGLLDPRKMGALDFGPQSAWEDVWANDLEDPRSTPPPVPSSLQPSASVESCVDLYRRAQEAFTRLEATYYGEDVVIVSHQDTLSLFAAALNGTELGRHHLDYKFDLGDVMCVDLTVPPDDRKFSPTDLRGDYAVGDSAINYRGEESAAAA